MNLFECDPKDEIFSNLDHETGEQLHFNVTKMFAWCCGEHEKFELINAQIEPTHVAHILTNKNIEPWRLSRLGDEQLKVPLLGVLMESGETLLVDGHHRLVRLYADGQNRFLMFRVNPGSWERFLVNIYMTNIDEYVGCGSEGI